jgi:RNA polymerase sigma-70 factor (ECF subfamily)
LLPDPTDEELMARVQQRDQEAFTRLLDRHLAGLRRFLQRFTGNPADADELTQEAMLRIWSHARRWQPDRVKFSTWLYRIARNLTIDRHRQRRDTSSEALEAIVDSTPDAFTQIDEERRKQRTQIAVAALPERQRTALLLCHFDGFSNQEAAAVLDVSVDALESLLSRARRTLKITLSPLLECNEASPCTAPQ